MALPQTPTTSWMQNLDFPSQFFESNRNDFELYEEDEFILSVELPGFNPDDITVSWDRDTLNIAAEAEQRGQRKTYHRRFRFPKTVDDDEISAQYTNGILEVSYSSNMEPSSPGKKSKSKPKEPSPFGLVPLRHSTRVL